MKKILAIVLVLCLAFVCAACNTGAPNDDPKVDDPKIDGPGTEAPFKVGVILVHDENSGYDLAHIEGVKAAAAELGLAESQLIFKYNIPEDETCYDTAIDLAEQGCNIIFSDSYGHQSFMMQAAPEYPDIMFVACTGDTAMFQPVDNVANVFPYTFESRYVSGVVAGMKLKELMDEGKVAEPHIGYVGAYPYAEVVSGYTAFFLGIRSIVPEAYMDVQFTNSWYDPIAEAEAANALIARGAVIIGQHADSTGAPGAVEKQREAGKEVYSVGYNVSMLAAAPTAALTSAQNNWVVLYKATLEKALKGEPIPTDYAAGYELDAVMISELGPSCAAGTAEKVAEVIAAIKAGILHVFDTATFTVNGETVASFLAIDTDGDWVGDTGEAIENGIFIESVLRSAPYFSLDIDGITKLN